MVLLQSEFCDKKPMRKTLYTLLLPIIVCSCMGQEDKEEEYAGRMLDAARTLMTEGNYVAAKDSILAMRETFPTAFKGRATGIIVMDSIELLAAQDTLAIMDSTLRAEQEILKKLESEKRRGHNAEYYRQRTDVFHLKQRFDELGAKVKFYLRKIEVDILERDKGFDGDTDE